ncbi:MAG: LLM class flavin-dependent oxidoreductase [Candidatus Rokubacteria bacterium]|nr:LLM class flavin-dependent oxidoreductase [Candidatus Rokubacteria bacterium]
MIRLGFQVNNWGELATGPFALETARRAEALGYDSLVVTDHVVIPHRVESPYPYSPTGRLAVPPEWDYLEALSLLAFLAGATKTADEWIRIFKALWTEERASFEGRFYRFPEVGCFPKPVQKPHPPIWVGGNSRPAIRRAARLGDGWHAVRVPAGELRGLCGYLREQVAASGRAPGDCALTVLYGIRVVGPGDDATRRPTEEDPEKVFVGTVAQVAEQIKPVLDLGPTDAIFHCRTGSGDEVLETMERLAGEVWPSLAK